VNGITLHNAPPAKVVLPHYIFGAIAFLVLCLMLLFSYDCFGGHYFHPKLLALTHLAALGWASMIIFGALYQLLPVIIEKSLYSEKLALVTFLLFGCGIILLAFAFWNFYVGIHLQLAALLIFLSFLLLFTNVYLSIRASGSDSIASSFILCSVMWLVLTGAIGVLMAFNLRYPFLPASHLEFLKIHAHMGIAGWFVLLIMGVSSRLIPLFLLSPRGPEKRLVISFYLVNAGLIGFSAHVFFKWDRAWTGIYALVILAGFLLFISHLHAIFRKRARRQLDIGLRHSLTAFIMAIIPILAGTALSFGLIRNEQVALHICMVYGTSIFLGMITALVLGQTFKTLPFIVWLHRYRAAAGKAGTPLPRDLYSENIAAAQFYFYLAAFFFIITGAFFSYPSWIRTGAFLLLIAAVLYNLNLLKILLHTARPKSPVIQSPLHGSK
jgi:hypothetical protein